MTLQISNVPLAQAECDWLIVATAEPVELAGPLEALNGALGGALARLKESGDLTGSAGEIVSLRGIAGAAAKRVLLVGLGKAADLDVQRLDKALMTAVREVTSKRSMRVAIAVGGAGGLSRSQVAQSAATAAVVGGNGPGLYKQEAGRYPLESITLIESSDDSGAFKASVERGEILGQSINLARELINRGPHEIYPESFAERARQAAADCGFGCEVFDEGRMRHERFGSMLAVAQGSERPPRMVVLDYRGAGPGAPTLAFVGKGVTFDSGGLSLKPTDGMLTMKCDMAGAATVLAAVTAIARLKLKVNIQGYLGLVENMVSGTSYKLGDVLTARNGVTIEVHNTDAEGRLVLADVLAYAVDAGVDRIIDLATLTGACVVALGEDVVGSFTNNAAWGEQVMAAAKSCGEDMWPMPMHSHFADLLKSDVADVKNVGPRWGGAVTAAKFLEKFVGDKPWVHLDIAGPAFASSSKPHRDGGATGCMVRTLVEVASRAAST